MKIENGKLVFESIPCRSCDGSLKVNEWVKCSACNGSGKADPQKPKGRNCKVCASQSSFAKGQVLSIGTGDCHCITSATPGTEMENICSTAPDAMWQGLAFKVYRSDRHQTIGESLLGHGCAWSVTDYGRSKSLTDDELIAKCRDDHHGIQATSFAGRDGTICDHIGIFCNDNGYSVKAVFGNAEAIQEDFKHGLTEAEGMYVGTRLAARGLNGTMLAVLARK